ncbi:MAG: hypothetical protein EZS28_024200 [Streblomastix strix]|uniref:RRM domain-containing protein n=1 Tax=Streblomastix strix TaxID=222440 RepID=A0A5J4VD24_9EUKA|nr:MAG: hypothetical protein EZS28_024200 [Streblomastix strix]
MIAEIILPNVEIAQQSSLEMNDKTILEQSIHVYFDGPIFQIRNNSLFVENNRALFLSHIPNNVSVQELKDVFTYPKPERIVRVFDRQQEKFMDFASVIFPSTADREMILETIGREIILKGKNIQMRRFGKKLQDEEDKGKSEQRSQKDEQMTSLDSQKLIIINIPQEISTSQIEQVFMKFGEVKFTIPLNIRTGHQFQFGFALFKTTEQAGAALNSLNGKDIFRVGYGLQISFAEPVTDANSKLTVLNLPPNITKHHRAVIVLNDYNKVKNVIRDQNNMIIDGCIINIQKVLTQEEKLYRKSDFWKLINRKDVNIRGLEQQVYELQEKAHEMQVYSQKSHELVQKIEIDKQIEYAGNNACELFVNGISSLHSNEDLLQQFKQFGAVKAYVQKEKGFGFVTFLSVRNAQTAINAMNGRIIGGRKIKVNFGNKAPQFNKDRDMKTALENEHLNEEAARNAEAEVNDAIHELQNLKQRLMIRETSKDKLSIFVNNNEISDSEEEEEEEEEGSCMICNDDLSEGNICSCNCERHHFIHCECLKASLESDLNQFQLNIRCIADPDCIAEYSMELLEQLLDEGKYSLLQELLIINYGGSEADERSILQEKMPEQEKIEKENEVDQQKREDHEFEKAIAAALTNALIRYCPQCGRGIIQEQGLSIIQCVCQKFFCQNCQKDISEIKFKHFQEEKCKLNIPANSIDRQQRQIKKAQEAAEKFVKEHPQFDNCDQKMKKCLDLWI